MASDATDQPKPAKRSIFKKSVFARPIPAADEDEEPEGNGVSFFSRRDEVFADVLAQQARARKQEAERQKQAELEKARAKAEREDETPPPPVIEPGSTSQERKRRRESRGREGESVTPTKRKATRRSSRNRSPSPINTRSRMPATISESVESDESEDEYRPTQTSRKLPPGALASNTITILDDSDDDDDTIQMKPTVDEEEDDLDEAEEEFPELAALARERAEQQRLEALRSSQQHSLERSLTPSAEGSSSQKAEPDFPVQLLITSQIPESVPLLIHRRLGQRLQDVRRVWCDRQVFDGQPWPENIKRTVFLTWRGNRIFDLTTCRSLGLKIDPTGTYLVDTDGHGFEDGKIHLEAWTDALYKEYRETRDKKKMRLYNAAESDQEEELAPPPVEETASKLRIVMRAKDLPDVKILVRPTDKVSKIMSYFSKTHRLSPGKTVSIYFDGEQLQPDWDLGDVGLDEEEQENLDVYIN